MYIKKFIVIVLMFLFSAKFKCQDTIKVMEYSLLTYKSSDANSGRYKDLRTIVAYAKPDILMVDELDNNTSAKYLLDSAMNKAGVGTYSRAVFYDGYDTDNTMYYKPDKVTLKSQQQITTTLRDISQYYVYKIISPGDTAWLYLYMAHLKAGGTYSTAEGTQRGAEVTLLCNSISSIPQNKNIIFAGDFNLKNNLEPAWVKMTTNCSHLFYDPINKVGNWAGNAFFKNNHSQSNRSTANPGCCFGVTGGLDDRFDFIVGNSPIINGTNKMKFLPSTYKVIGNDGNHFNLSIIESPANTSVPSLVNQALFNTTDHLPVIVNILVSPLLISVNEVKDTKNAALLLNRGIFGLELFAQIKYNDDFDLIVLDAVGRILISKKIQLTAGNTLLNTAIGNLNNGLYYVTLTSKTNKVSSIFPVNN
jgi:endonuclease/exonuclease/phosphatase (EEP) superfamily protein YafD